MRALPVSGFGQHLHDGLTQLTWLQLAQVPRPDRQATAYRYFPDLPSLIREALAGVWPPPRVAFACEYLLRGILARQGSVRAMIAATITRPEIAATRPGIRFGLIDHALMPAQDTLGSTDPDAFAQGGLLRRGDEARTVERPPAELSVPVTSAQHSIPVTRALPLWGAGRAPGW
ncbi:hypothetical protein [Streptomyces sp. NPDC004629]|uniref:hypothetical protein n=1 Tax=Streptomyces sp. NPDC004629 TaxID=3364705 RepID=UPI003685A9BB